MKTTLTAIATLALAAAANADIVSATVTADNHYALYTGTDDAVTFIGRNEMGAGGTPGTYNWSQPETWSFTTGSYIYIAAWSDDAVAQGLLAQVTGLSDTYHSGDARWQVFPTFVNLGDGDAAPTGMQLTAYIADANSGNKWEAPHVGAANGIGPWGAIAGIGSAPRWMWVQNPGQADPLQGGSGYGEMLIFRMSVPAPGAAAALGLGGLAALRRRRR
ncbi:MAG TPA: PEP-CTERM sorting domain-containing protein [Phycisphaerales bacterium]|nr:PEP-CTERM sorting domain-containing protein [Phycisphaerales bacterium]